MHQIVSEYASPDQESLFDFRAAKKRDVVILFEIEEATLNGLNDQQTFQQQPHLANLTHVINIIVASHIDDQSPVIAFFSK